MLTQILREIKGSGLITRHVAGAVPRRSSTASPPSGRASSSR
ncbi:hypothetical protein [Methylobacterium frigidaeris]|nr:hypothetical protein [Methylobacterium frigidaeris]